MKKFINYTKPLAILLILMYVVGVLKSASFNPVDFGYKTRIILSGLWLFISLWVIMFKKATEV